MTLFSDEMRRDPFPVYEHFRNVSPVLHAPSLDAWLIFDYDGVKRALDHHGVFSSGVPAPDWFNFCDPPRHTRLRGLISRAFTPRSIASLEPRIRELSRRLLDRVIKHGKMDLVTDYAIPLPLGVIVQMLGIPASDLDRYKRWSEGILKLSYSIFGGEDKSQAFDSFRIVTTEMRMYLSQWIEQRRAQPQDDLLTRLIEVETDGERLTEEEILGFVQLLLLAGQETTTNLINGAVLCLLENPSALALLRSRPDLLPSAIEEVARYRSPFQWVFRTPKCDVEMRGQVIPAGQIVLAVIGSANRDSRQFSNAEGFDIMRNPNPHLGFGHGIHYCLGGTLSRLEARIALTDLLERLEGLELVSANPWKPQKALNMHGPAHLPIRFQAEAFLSR